MIITSMKFLGFCVSAVILFLLFPKKYRWISLLLSSMAFYWIGAKKVIVFIIFTSLVVWFAARKIDAAEAEGAKALAVPDIAKEDKKRIKQETQKKRRIWMQLALFVCVGALVGFKLLNLFGDAFKMLAGMILGTERGNAIRLFMPLGISYYTFSTVGYLLDVYWKRYKSEPNFARFFLYAIYFPHIMQGPISRYNKLGQELKKPELHFTWNNFVIGMECILLGCFKKLVIADRVSVFVSKTLMVPDLKGAIYLLALILDAIQIYTDFSGYMDIVSGVSRMFDVELEQNFNHPFFARSVPEFWRRWHMSLGSWFKDYVYYPISISKTVKNINKKARTWKSARLRSIAGVILPIMVTWLLTGLWHGTGAGYVAWGLYYGTLIALSVTFSEDVEGWIGRHNINTASLPYRIFQTLKIFAIFMGGRFLGSTMDMTQRLRIIKNMIVRFPTRYFLGFGFSVADFVIVLIGMAILIFIAVIEEKESIFDWFNRQNKVFCAVVLWTMFYMVFLLGVYGEVYSTAGFMYQQF